MCFLGAVFALIDDAEHVLFKSSAAIDPVPMSTRSNIVPIPGWPKVALQIAMSRDVLRNDKSSFLHPLLKGCWYNVCLHCWPFLDQVSHWVTKTFPLLQQSINIFPATSALA